MIDSVTRARLDQHNIAAQAITYRGLADGLFEVLPNWARGYSGINLPTFNIFLPLTLAGLSDEVLADTAAFFSSREVMYAVELIHDRLPEGPDYLTERRYQALPPQMAMFLPEIPDQLASPPDISIEPVRTVPGLAAFCTLLHQVFDFPLKDTVRLFPVAQLKKESPQNYVAFIEEKPVGAGTMICAEGVVSVWNICTLDSYRQRGVATALLQRLLADGQDCGCNTATLYSTAQAYSLFNKFGFEIYTQRQWFLPPGLDYEEE